MAADDGDLRQPWLRPLPHEGDQPPGIDRLSRSPTRRPSAYPTTLGKTCANGLSVQPRQRQVGHTGARFLERGRAVVHRADVACHRLEQQAQRVGRVLIVVDDEHTAPPRVARLRYGLRGREWLRSADGARGSVGSETVNALPRDRMNQKTASGPECAWPVSALGTGTPWNHM